MSRILIIEDEASIAELEKDYLEQAGYEAVIEEDGTVGGGVDRKSTRLNSSHQILI